MSDPANRGCIRPKGAPSEIPEDDWRLGAKSPRGAAEFSDESLRSVYSAMGKGELRWVQFQRGRRIPVLDLMRRLNTDHNKRTPQR